MSIFSEPCPFEFQLKPRADDKTFAECQRGLSTEDHLKFTAPECNYFGQPVDDYTRIYIDKTKQRVQFVEESETQVTIVIEPK